MKPKMRNSRTAYSFSKRTANKVALGQDFLQVLQICVISIILIHHLSLMLYDFNN